MYTNHPVFRRLRETARRLNACGLVTFADQILRMIAYMDGTDRSLQNVKMMNQQSPVEFAMAVAKAKSVSPEAAVAVMSAIATASSDIADTGAIGSELISNTIGAVLGSAAPKVGDLCLTAAGRGNIHLELTGRSALDHIGAYSIEYKINDGEWSLMRLNTPAAGGPGDYTSVSVVKDDKVYFKGNISTDKYQQNDDCHLTFVLSGGGFDVNGDVMSMYGHNTPNPYDLCGLFNGCTQLYDAKDLVLPDTVSNGCCVAMFDTCENLQSAPILRAEELADNCYVNMFSQCRNLHELTCYAHANGAACVDMLDAESEGTFKCKYPDEWGPETGLPAGWSKLKV